MQNINSARLGLLGAFLAIAAAAVAQTPRYAVTNVGTLTGNEVDHPVAMSSDGSKVVGYANYISGTTYTGITHTFMWDGTLHDVGLWTNTAPFVPGPIAVSNDGTVLLGAAHARIWTRSGGSVQLFAPDGSEGVACGINDSDVVAGRGRTTNLLGFDVNGNPIYAWTALKWSRDPVSGSWSSTSLDPLPGYNVSGGFGGIDANGNIFGTSAYVDPTSGATLANEATLWSPLDGYIPTIWARPMPTAEAGTRRAGHLIRALRLFATPGTRSRTDTEVTTRTPTEPALSPFQIQTTLRTTRPG